MSFNITPTNLIGSAVQVLVSWAVGILMVVCVAIVYFKVSDGMEVYDKYQSMFISDTARVHIYDGTDDKGYPRLCVAVERDSGRIDATDATISPPDRPIPVSQFCDNILQNSTDWRNLAIPDPTSTLEKLFWSIPFVLVFGFAFYMFARIPAGIAGYLTGSAHVMSVTMVLAMFVPLILCMGIFLHSAWSYHPSVWVTNGYAVETHKVFIDDKGKLYKAPETFYDWADNETLRNISTGYKRW